MDRYHQSFCHAQGIRMHYFLLAALISIISAPLSASDGGISISIGQPGFYGQITLGNQYPAPRLIYPNPVLIIPPAVAIQQQPIYLFVPPGHAKRWDRYCSRYNACNQPVYFVQKDWYNNEYLPHYHTQSNYPGGNNDSARHQHDDDDARNRSQSNKHNDRDHPGQGKDKNRSKHDQGDHGKKDHDRGNRKD